MATRIMVIDDEPLICQLLTYQLGGAGYEVTAYQHAYDALLQLARAQPDLILLDVMMPDMSGWDLCRQIRSSSSLPIIMLTAKDGDDDVVRGLTGGADDYVSKPFNQAQLIARIEAVLRRAQVITPRVRPGSTGMPGGTHTTLASVALASVATDAPEGAVLAPPPPTAEAPRPIAGALPPVAPATPRASPTLPRLGPSLATARRQRGLTLHDADQACGVRWEFLQAIEQEEFNYVPRAELRYALRAYSTFLGVDLKPYVTQRARRRRPVAFSLAVGMAALVALTLVVMALML